MHIVKLTFNYDWPIFRQTPNLSGVWGNYKFVIDPNLKECDYWVIYTEYGLVSETCICNKNNIIFIPGEGINTSNKFPQKFLDQFGKILTVQRELKGDNIIYGQNANPWFIERSYDELIALSIPEKNKILSVISSDKDFTEGHRKRISFVKKLKEHFGDKIDVFGRGINDFKNKWDVSAPYKYQIAIENDFCDDWVTEKLFDPILTFTHPIYYGCPNLDRYMPDSAYTRIDIEDFESSIRIIEKLIEDDRAHENYLLECKEFQKIYLNKLQLFPAISAVLDTIINSKDNKEVRTINGVDNFRSKSFKEKFKFFLKSFYIVEFILKKYIRKSKIS